MITEMLACRVVRGVNLARGRFYDDEFVFISEDLADRMPGARLLPGDLVFTHRGSVVKSL